MGVDDAFGKTRGAGGKAHGRAIVFVNRGIAEVVSGSGKQFFVIQKAFGHGVETVGDHDNAFERGVFAKLFIDGIKHVVDKEKAVPSVLGDGGNFVGMKAQVQRIDRKSTRLNSSHGYISYAVFCLKKKNKTVCAYT